MKKDTRQVLDALVLVFQFGINMIVPIFLCCLLGIWIGNKTGISWMMIPFFLHRRTGRIYEYLQDGQENIQQERQG